GEELHRLADPVDAGDHGELLPLGAMPELDPETRLDVLDNGLGLQAVVVRQDEEHPRLAGVDRLPERRLHDVPVVVPRELPRRAQADDAGGHLLDPLDHLCLLLRGGRVRAAINRSMIPALQLRDLTKRYDDGTLALDALDLEVPAGSFFGLLGPNGAGKTTLISAVCNLIRLTAGEISVFGEPGGSMEARRLVGVAEPEPHLAPFLTVHQT